MSFTKLRPNLLDHYIGCSARKMGVWRLSAFVISFALIIGTGFFTHPDSLAHILESNSIEAFNLKAHWAQGNVVALVRHAERCDHSDHQCLNGDTGITVIGKDISIKLGDNFEYFLTRDHTVFYNSPLKRTYQTAQFMFDGASISKEWLHDNCKERFLEDILKNKSDGINMVLVTHSTCINNLHNLNNNNLVTIDAGADTSYALTVFLTISKEDQKAYVLGYVYANDWKNLSHKTIKLSGAKPTTNKHLL